jgi:hypothetical protein
MPLICAMITSENKHYRGLGLLQPLFYFPSQSGSFSASDDTQLAILPSSGHCVVSS